MTSAILGAWTRPSSGPSPSLSSQEVVDEELDEVLATGIGDEEDRHVTRRGDEPHGAVRSVYSTWPRPAGVVDSTAVAAVAVNSSV